MIFSLKLCHILVTRCILAPSVASMQPLAAPKWTPLQHFPAGLLHAVTIDRDLLQSRMLCA